MSRPSNGSIRDAARKRAQLRGGGMTPVTSAPLNVPDAKPREPRLPVLRVKDGETVAVTIIDHEETRIGQYFDEGDFIRLQPLNPFLDPIYEPRMNVRIEARVVAVIRTF